MMGQEEIRWTQSFGTSLLLTLPLLLRGCEEQVVAMDRPQAVEFEQLIVPDMPQAWI